MVFNCKNCNIIVNRKNKKKGFCSKKCSSSYYMKCGIYKKVLPRPKKTEKRKCLNCNLNFECIPSKLNKTCSWKCRNEYISKTKKNLGKEPIQKSFNTLKEKYGFNTPFAFAKHTSLSRPQKELINYLQNNTKYTILFDHPLYTKEEKLYKVDILIKEKNLIIEFNGTYWHADPRFYTETCFIQKKQKTSKQIWEEDEKRVKNLIDMGYDVKIIWEYDYNKNKQQVLLELINE